MARDNAAWPCLYQPPRLGDTPLDTFHREVTPHWRHCNRCTGDASYRAERLVSKYDPHAVLVFVDGCCLDNGLDDPRGGAGFLDSYDPNTGIYLGDSLPLENYGPDGRWHRKTNNRAELRAVVAALRCADWTKENVRRLVIATDSEYIANGCGLWSFDWEHDGWRKRSGEPVANRDLWRLVNDCLYDWSDKGLQVEFWRIPRAQNFMADGLAKNGARLSEEVDWNDDW